jgi:hypothetical protein
MGKGGRRRSAKIAGLIAAALCANVAPAAALRLAVSSPCAGFSAAAAARSSGARPRQFAPRCGLPALALTSAAISTKLVAAAKVAAAPVRPPPPAWLSFGRWQLLLGQELAGAAGDQPLPSALMAAALASPPPPSPCNHFHAAQCFFGALDWPPHDHMPHSPPGTSLSASKKCCASECACVCLCLCL